MNKKIVINILIVIFTGTLLFSLGKIFIGENYSMYKTQIKRAIKTKSINLNSADTDDSAVTAQADNRTPEQKSEDKVEAQEMIAEMKGDIKDMAGWITVPDTSIDRAVVQGTDNTYYLNHDEYGQYQQIGALYFDYEIDLNADPDNTIIYGHYIKGNYMFGPLRMFYNEDRFRNCGPIRVETERGVDYYRVFGVSTFDLTKPDGYFEFNEYINMDTLEKKQEYLDRMKKFSLFWTDTPINADSKFMTLATCSYMSDNSRLIILAIRE